jgi:hypothetical protein
MKSMISIALLVAVFPLVGCENKRDVKIDTPNVKVNAGPDGATVETPNVKVDADKEGATVDTPKRDVDVDLEK